MKAYDVIPVPTTTKNPQTNQYLRRKRITQSVSDNIRENSKHTQHKYAIDDSVLIILTADDRRKRKKIYDSVTEGSYKITKLLTNETVRTLRDHYEETIGIIRIRPYHTI